MRNCCLWAYSPQWETHSFVALPLSLNTFLSLIYGLILELMHWQVSTHIFSPCKLVVLPQEWNKQTDIRLFQIAMTSAFGQWWCVGRGQREQSAELFFHQSNPHLGSRGGLADTSSWSPSSSLNNAASLPRPLPCTLVTLSPIALLFEFDNRWPVLNKTNGKLGDQDYSNYGFYTKRNIWSKVYLANCYHFFWSNW